MTEAAVTYRKLGNGAHLLIKRRPHLPLVSLAVAARGGSALEPRANAGITALMARTSIKGTRQRTAAEIAEQAERMGGSVAPAAGSDLIDWEISVPSRHFTDAFSLVADVAFDAAFPEAALEVERKLTLADLQHTRDDMYRYPLRLCLQAGFAGHAYGYSLEDIERGVSNVDVAGLSAWQRQRMSNQSWIIIVGDIDPELAMRAAETLGPAHRVPAAEPAPAPEWPAVPVSLTEQRAKAQSALAIGFPGPDRNHEDVYALQVLANAVGGLGGRFFEELRSKRSLAYTVSLLPVFRAAGGMFIGYIATTPEREEEARSGLLEQFATLVNQPLTDEEIERSKRYTIGTWQIRSQTNAAQLSDLLQAHLLGSGMAEIDGFEARIRAVTAQRIQEVARRYFKPELAVQGVVRGKSRNGKE